jgi:polysaccharide export outer membrane protein
MKDSYMTRSTLFFVTLLSALSLTSVLAQEEKKESRNEARPPEKQTPPDKATENLPAPVDPKTYKIGPEDVLTIKVWQEPQLSSIVQVRPDGVISPDLIGELQVNGLTPEQLKERLTTEFSKLVNNPLVNVQVSSVRSKKYFMTGPGLLRNGEYTLVVPTTVLEALVRAGGFTEWANKKKIIIMRGDKRFFFNYNDYVKKGKNPESNIYVENGDLIIVN